MRKFLASLVAVVAITGAAIVAPNTAAASVGSTATSLDYFWGHAVGSQQCTYSARATDIGASTIALTYRYQNCASLYAQKAACATVYGYSPYGTGVLFRACQPYTTGDYGRVTTGIRFHCIPGHAYLIEAMLLYVDSYTSVAVAAIAAGPVTCTWSGPASATN